jgi:hypothetical protein
VTKHPAVHDHSDYYKRYSDQRSNSFIPTEWTAPEGTWQVRKNNDSDAHKPHDSNHPTIPIISVEPDNNE